MKTLFLIRHARAVKDAGGSESDAHRVLDPRGVADIAALRPGLLAAGFAPQRILCSSATRTLQTMELLAFPGADAHIEPDLYLALAGHLFERVQQQPDGCQRLMLVGHNPGLHQLAVTLARREDTPRLVQFPPLSCAALQLDIGRWEDLVPGTGHLVSFLMPS